MIQKHFEKDVFFDSTRKEEENVLPYLIPTSKIVDLLLSISKRRNNSVDEGGDLFGTSLALLLSLVEAVATSLEKSDIVVDYLRLK